MKKLLAAFCAVLLCAVSPAYAAEAVKPETGKHDTKLPVEVSSDTLEVLQRESRAIFRGNVIAVQGKLRMSADKMIVHYKQQGEKGTPAAFAGKKDGDMGAITHIEVEGNVLIATPEETAEGEKGDYDVEKRFLHLTGQNVVLTRGQNVLRGKSVDYNLDTGRSVLTNSDAPDASKKGKGGDNRVRGVFVPKGESK